MTCLAPRRTKNRREVKTVEAEGQGFEEQPSSSSISSYAAVVSEKSSRDRHSGGHRKHKDVVFNNETMGCGPSNNYDPWLRQSRQPIKRMFFQNVWQIISWIPVTVMVNRCFRALLYWAVNFCFVFCSSLIFRRAF